MINRTIAFAVALGLCVACSKKSVPASADGGSVAASAVASAVAAPAATSAAPAAVAAVPAGALPPDGKYERVIVDGVTVPMIHVMNGGTVILVDTDGKKPRTWEEQYKRKGAQLLTGQFDIHKTDANKNDKFEDDPIDKEGLWVIDVKGNLTKH